MKDIKKTDGFFGGGKERNMKNIKCKGRNQKKIVLGGV